MIPKVAVAQLLAAVLCLAACPGSTSGLCEGVTCAPGRTCVDGICQQTSSNCTSHSECPSGQFCAGGSCVYETPDLGWRPDTWTYPPPDTIKLHDGPLIPTPDGPKPDGAPPKPDGPPLKWDTNPPPDTKPSPDTPPPPDAAVPTGKWYQANAKNCVTFCSGKGLVNVPSPEGARCMSGENRPASGVAAGIKFTYNCWPNCAAQTGTNNASSSGVHCYRPGQKTDGDGSDLTVGCFCK
jgi:hypothetical protein